MSKLLACIWIISNYLFQQRYSTVTDANVPVSIPNSEASVRSHSKPSGTSRLDWLHCISGSYMKSTSRDVLSVSVTVIFPTVKYLPGESQLSVTGKVGDCTVVDKMFSYSLCMATTRSESRRGNEKDKHRQTDRQTRREMSGQNDRQTTYCSEYYCLLLTAAATTILRLRLGLLLLL